MAQGPQEFSSRMLQTLWPNPNGFNLAYKKGTFPPLNPGRSGLCSQCDAIAEGIAGETCGEW